jgi:cyclopropane-fatty-acyl-phospholipid synthase
MVGTKRRDMGLGGSEVSLADARVKAKEARDSVDFIKRHIFPGSSIPSVAALALSVAKVSKLRIVDLEDNGPHHATMFAAWRNKLFTQAHRLQAFGYTDPLIRMFDLHVSYCEGGFLERALGDVQIVLQDSSSATHVAPRI